MSRGMRIVGDVAVAVGADVRPLVSEFGRGGAAVNRFERNTQTSAARLARRLRSVATAAAAMGAAMLAASRRAISAMDEIGKKADRLGLTTDELQRLRFAANSAGVETNALDIGMQRFTRRVAEAASGSGSAADELEEMGIQLRNANGEIRSTTDILGDVAEALNNTESQADRVRLAFSLFDSEGVALVNMLQGGRDAFLETTAAADQFGAVIEERAIRSAEQLQDQLGMLGDGIRGQLNEALVEMGPLLVDGAEFILRLATAFNNLVEQIGSTFRALDDYLNPLNDVERGTREVVAAMGEEIIQSQRLDAALDGGIRMSVAMAEQKLAEARTRFENARAAIAEQQAIARSSDALGQVNEQLQRAQEIRDAIAPPGADEGLIPLPRREAFEVAEQRMADIIAQREALLSIPEDLAEQASRAEENIGRLQDAIADAVGGVVDTRPGALIEPLEPGEEGEQGGGGRSPREEGDGSFLERLLGLDEESQQSLQERMYSALERQNMFMEEARAALLAAREQGLIDQATYHEASERLEAEHNRAMRRLRMENVASALGSTSEMFSSLAQIASDGGERLLRVSKIISAAQAFVNTLAGASEALRLPFPANLAAAAQVMSTGLGFVAAIKGTTPGGAHADPGGGSAGTSAQSVVSTAEEAATKITREINVNLRGPSRDVGMIRDFIAAINEELDDGANLTLNITGS